MELENVTDTFECYLTVSLGGRFNACKDNKTCGALYQLIVAKGKNKKLVLIAVANKQLKKAFAIAKSGLEYDAQYRSVKPNFY